MLMNVSLLHVLSDVDYFLFAFSLPLTHPDWSSSVPNYNPRDIIANIRRFMKGESMKPMTPWYRGFKCKIDRKGQGFGSSGLIRKVDAETLHVTELPIKMWTEVIRRDVSLFLDEKRKYNS